MRHATRIAFAIGLAAALSARAAQEVPPQVEKKETAPAAWAVTPEKLQERIKDAEVAADLDDELKKKITDLLKQALASLQKANEAKGLAESYRLALKDAPARAEEIRAKLKQDPPVETPIQVPPDATAKAIDQLLDQRRAELAGAKSELDKTDARLKTLQGRPQKAREEQLAAAKKTEEMDKALKAVPAEGENPRLTESSRLALEAASRARAEEVAMLEQEIVSHPARLDLQSAERELAARGLAALQAALTKLEEVATQRRNAEAKAVTQDAERAKREARDKHPLVKSTADDNAMLGRELARVTADTNAVLIDKRYSEDKGRQLKDIFERTSAQLERVGLQGIGGNALREQGARLPAIAAENQRVWSKWRGRVGEAESRRFQIGMDLRDLADPAVAVSVLLAKQPAPVNGREELAAALQPLLAQRAELLEKLDTAHGSLLKNLAELDTAQAQLADTARKFSGLLEEWLPWIPSAAPFGLKTLKDLAGASAWLSSPANWWEVLATWHADVLDAPLYALLGLALLAGMFLAAPWARRRIDTLGARLGHASTDSFHCTLQALGLTVLLAAPYPFLAAFLGWRAVEAGTHPFALGVGRGLLTAAEVLFMLRLFARLCAPSGVAATHFYWEDHILALLRKHLRWFIPVLVPTAFLVALAESQDGEAIRNSLGRCAFIVGVLAQAVFSQRIIRPNGGITADVLRRYPTGWLARLRFVWYPLAVGVPAALAVTSAAGHHFTAMEFERRVVVSIWIIVCVILLHALALRWYAVEERRLAARKARERREAEFQAARAAGQAPEGAAQAPPDVPAVDVSKIDAQMRALLRTFMGFAILVGLWLVWARALPALAMLDNVRLWGSTAAGEGGVAVMQWITLGNLAVAVIVLMLTAAAAKSLPGVLEIVVLKNLPLDTGIRYAVTMVSQYVVVAVGLIAAFNAIGIGWSKVQWLAAALSVGVGFGLQEIIANFISGLILLFERPIRVGDIVTVGDVAGTVSRIRIRATTITNWDRMEYIVPNKDLITGRLLNWTLSNTVNRIVITVGVAYEADTDKARALLLKTAREHPLVMRDPEPLASFEGFGESALTMVLRCYLSDFTNRMAVIHELHTAIKKSFDAAGIEIAFPQLEVRVKSDAPPAKP